MKTYLVQFETISKKWLSAEVHQYKGPYREAFPLGGAILIYINALNEPPALIEGMCLIRDYLKEKEHPAGPIKFRQLVRYRG